MQDVEEIVAVMVSMSTKAVSGAGDIVLEALRSIVAALGSGGGSESRVTKIKNSMLKPVPYLGESGQVSAEKLMRNGETVEVVENVQREDLKQLERQLKKMGVAFAVIKNPDDTVSVLFKAKDYNCMANALSHVSAEHGVTSEEIERIAEGDLDPSDRSFDGTTLRGIEWRSRTGEEGAEAVAQVGPYDVTVRENGNWTVSTSGSVVMEGPSPDGTFTSGLVKAAAAANDAKNQTALKKGMPELEKPAVRLGNGAPQAGQGKPARTVAREASAAIEKAKAKNAGLEPKAPAKAKGKARQ